MNKDKKKQTSPSNLDNQPLLKGNVNQEIEIGEMKSRDSQKTFNLDYEDPNKVDKDRAFWTFKVNDTNMSDDRFKINKIITSKYTRYTFVPKNLFEQFSKMANVYFLFILVLQVIPPISISGGQPTILLPLLFVISVSAVKDLFEDYSRHRSDSAENNKKVMVANPKTQSQENRIWKYLRVGEIVKVTNNQFFPADLILLYSSGKKGICYIETKNLDGETNLKHKVSNKEIMTYCKTEKLISSLKATVSCEKPNDKIYQFDGVMYLDKKKISLSYENFLLRGSSLKNTDYIYGIVTYPGHDTKIMLNSCSSKVKFSRIEKQTNVQILYIFILQLIFCSIATIYGSFWRFLNTEKTREYLDLGKGGNSLFDTNWALNAIQRFFTWILIFTNLVPISLMVTLEVVKFMQAFFIEWDYRIYDKEKDMKTKVQASNLNEELGQIHYVFSDKTGTLTCNIMEFKKFSAGKHSYGNSLPDNKSAMRFHLDGQEDIQNVNFDDSAFYQHFKDQSHSNYEYIEKVILNLALCHTIIIENKGGKISYNASSPDELALVNAAKFFGVTFLDRDEDNNITIDFKGEKRKYQRLNLIEFNSTRKRMSVVVKDSKGVIKCLCKGADSILYPLLKDSHENKQNVEITNKFLEDFGKDGLRTLLIVEKVIPHKDYEAWNKKYQEACLSLKNREEQVEAVAIELEKDFQLVGSTAIEDKLQDGVGETIQCLKDAGIKVWVLTGDKIETAINIGYSAKLLNNEMNQMIVQGKTSAEVYQEIRDHLNDQEKAFQQDSAVIVNGEALLKIAADDEIKDRFLMLTDNAKVVIACRVSPKQKAEIVMFVRQKFVNSCTLAIGDGANDVNMINSAHVGVGISGLEGQQAARSADYAIGQFKFLRNLIFAHGRECYRRNAYLVCYIFYKNIVFVIPQFFYGFLSAFGGQPLYEQWLYQFYNILFTAFPVMWFALFDAEFDRDEILTKPKAYKIGLYNLCFGKFQFWRWICYGLFQAAWLCYLTLFTLEGPPCAHDTYGFPSTIWISGTLVYSLVVILVNVKVLFSTHTHTIISCLVNILSILSFFTIFHLENNLSFVPQLNGAFIHAIRIPSFYFLIVFFIIFTLATETIMYWTGQYYKEKKEHKKIEEEKKMLKAKKKLMPTNYQGRATVKHMGFAYDADSAGHIDGLRKKKKKSEIEMQQKQVIEEIKEDQEDSNDSN